MTLSDFARRYVASRELEGRYSNTLQRRAAALEASVGQTALEQVLTEPHLNAFLASLVHLTRWTVRGYRGDLLTLWNAAADEDLAPYPMARRIRKPKIGAQAIECYFVDEARALLAAAEKSDGRYPNGVPRRLYWPGAIRLAWNAGYRRGDVWRFQRDAVRPDGSVVVVQNKSRRCVVHQLRPSTIAALDAIGRKQPCEWVMDEWSFGEHFQAIVKAAGVNRGTFKWLRRASGSYVEMQQPGAGYKHLGHSDPAVFGRHYDAHLGAHTLPMPPELD